MLFREITSLDNGNFNYELSKVEIKLVEMTIFQN